eukprot:TRINITY_DN25012_c0_g1_i1.p1 TRINITY_DN25012_c0_g1~~TRINITY_DN25012_c0_g1_i1.p1  ORF type:complete len:111 (-),score=18.03 TRINITY_DN25012_c0_g1_i1:34-366(-)
MVAQLNSVLLALSMSVYITGLQDECDFIWELQDDFSERYELNQLTINVYPKCSLKGASQSYVVTFHNTSLLTTLSGNVMAENVLRVNVLKYVYLDAVSYTHLTLPTNREV